VAWAAAAPAEAIPFATLPAEALSAPGGELHLGPGVAGRLVAWHVAPGERVAAGAPLADLRSPALSELQARLRAVDATAAEAARREALARSGLDHGVASAVDLAGATAERVVAEAERDALRDVLAAHRDTATREGLVWTWRAPTDGVVAALTCALQPVAADTTCVHVVRDGAVEVEVAVPERYLATVEGGAVSGTFLAADGRSWALRERARAPSLDPHTRARRLRFTAEGAPPLPGASGRARLNVPAGPDAVIVPAAALTVHGGADAVFTRRDGAAIPTPVTVLGREGEAVVVSGLERGAPVATRGVFLLKGLAMLEEAE
jgi:cobalt-zinc-cadmium efflux system membrane fusion protein